MNNKNTTELKITEIKENLSNLNNLNVTNQIVTKKTGANQNGNKKKEGLRVQKKETRPENNINQGNTKTVNNQVTNVVRERLPYQSSLDFVSLPSNNTRNQSRMSSNLQVKQKNINDGTFYLERENTVMLRDYGSAVYKYAREELESEVVPANFLRRHKFSSDIRTKMVDWIVEVLSVYRSEPDTFFLSVHIMDQFIFSSKTVISSSEIHLIGITSMFIASKQEDVIPIRMQSMVSKIGHNLFQDYQIRAKEVQILTTIGFDALISTSIYEFIRTYFFDFEFNNKQNIRQLKLVELVRELQECSTFLAMMVMYFDEFYAYRISLKSIACVIASFDVVRANSNFITDEGEKFLRDWIMFIIQESGYHNDTICEVYHKIVNYFKKYDSLTNISQNLTKYRPLKFYQANNK